MHHDTFRIELRHGPAETLLLLLSGELDLAAREPLRRLLDLLPLQAARRILVDASDADFVDASVVGALFSLAAALRALGKQLAFVDVRGDTRSIWRLTGWSDVCPTLLERPVTPEANA
jgi:anti-anti-sigma factor